MKISDIPAQRLAKLNYGLAPTSNLTEWLAVDQAALLCAVSERHDIKELVKIGANLPKLSIPKQIAWIGAQLAELKDAKILENHGSDIVRCWLCYAQITEAKSFQDSLIAIRPFAADQHFGVREIAWMAVRDKICADPLKAIDLLVPWSRDRDPNIRRFASEATRPRGVWAKHIKEFKVNPRPALPLLNELFTDTSRYVQDSVANWLNDAAKENPVWVKSVVKNWTERSSSKETQYIATRALRCIRN